MQIMPVTGYVEGGAENDRPENEKPSKCPSMNLTDMKPVRE